MPSLIIRILGDSKRFEGELRKTERQLKKFDRKVSDSLKNAAKFGVAAGAAVAVGIGVVAVKSAMDFEKAMSNVKAVSGATNEEFVALEKVARKMGRQTAFTALEAGDALVFMSMAGMSAKRSILALPPVLHLASAGNLELGESADIVTNIMAGYGLEASEIALATDKLTAAFTNANVTVPEIGEAFKMVAPLAKGAGISFDEVTTAVGMLGNIGIKGTMAGTTLKNMIVNLLRPTGAAKKALSEMGLSINMLMSGPGQLKPLSEIFGLLEEGALDAGKAVDIFGKRAGSNVFSLVDKGTAVFGELLEKIAGSEGLAKRIAEIQLANLAGQITIIKSQFNDIAITLGNVMLPQLKAAATWLAEALAHFGTDEGQALLAEYTEKVTAAFAAMGRTVEAIGSKLRPVADGIKVFTENSLLWKSALAAVSVVIVAMLIPSIIALGVALATNPVIAAIAAFAGLLAVVGWVDRRFGRLPAIITAVTGGLGFLTVAIVLGGKAWLMHTRAVVASSFARLKNIAITLGHASAMTISVIATKAVAAATWLWNAALWANPLVWVVAGIIALIAVIVLAVKHWDKITAAVKRAWRWFVDFIEPVNLLAKVWPSIWSAISSYFEMSMKNLRKAFELGFGWLLPGGILSRALGWLRSMLANLWRRIKSQWQSEGGILSLVFGADLPSLNESFEYAKQNWKLIAAAAFPVPFVIVAGAAFVVFGLLRKAWNALFGGGSSRRRAASTTNVLVIPASAVSLSDAGAVVTGILSGLVKAWKRIVVGTSKLVIGGAFFRVSAGVGKVVYDALKVQWDALTDTLTVAWDWATSAATSFAGTIAGTVSAAWNWAASSATKFKFQHTVPVVGIVAAWRWAAAPASDFAGKITGTVTAAWDWAASSVSGFVASITGGTQKVAIDATAIVFTDMRAWLRNIYIALTQGALIASLRDTGATPISIASVGTTSAVALAVEGKTLRQHASTGGGAGNEELLLFTGIQATLGLIAARILSGFNATVTGLANVAKVVKDSAASISTPVVDAGDINDYVDETPKTETPTPEPPTTTTTPPVATSSDAHTPWVVVTTGAWATVSTSYVGGAVLYRQERTLTERRYVRTTYTDGRPPHTHSPEDRERVESRTISSDDHSAATGASGSRGARGAQGSMTGPTSRGRRGTTSAAATVGSSTFHINVDARGRFDDFEQKFRKMLKQLQREGLVPKGTIA